MSRTVSYHTSAVSSIGAWHKAIREGDFDCMRMRGEEDASLLVRPNTIGWTALHYCAASPEIDFDTWKWVLKSIPKDTDLLQLRTDIGQNVVDQFFRRYLDPIGWQTQQVKEAAKELTTSIQHFLDDDEQLDLLRCVLDYSSEEHVLLTGDEISQSNNNHIVLVVSFWRRMEVLLQQISLFSNEIAFSIVRSLATAGCPKEVAQLTVRLYPAQLSQRDAHGSLPLHLACQHEGAATMMECLLPFHADTYDRNGRLPLHIALSFGKTWHDGGVSHLWKAHPLEGGVRDKESALPAFLLANFPCQTVVERATRATAWEIYKGLFRFILCSAQQKILADARQQVDLRYLSTIYELLRRVPNAIACCFQEGQTNGREKNN